MSSTRSTRNNETEESTSTTPITEVSSAEASPVTTPTKKKVLKKKNAGKSLSSSAKRLGNLLLS